MAETLPKTELSGSAAAEVPSNDVVETTTTTTTVVDESKALVVAQPESEFNFNVHGFSLFCKMPLIDYIYNLYFFRLQLHQFPQKS